uniref:Uncharacterized protein n=1 Tax=Arundo donax TaxID=35708 RepID=A0A0A8YVQ7_ARUDO
MNQSPLSNPSTYPAPRSQIRATHPNHPDPNTSLENSKH